MSSPDKFSPGDRVIVRGRTVRAGNVGVVVSKMARDEPWRVTDRYLVLLDADKARDGKGAAPRQFHETAMRAVPKPVDPREQEKRENDARIAELERAIAELRKAA